MRENRLCIFSFYDENGYADHYIFHLLKQISDCVSKIIIVVNGKVNDAGKIEFQKYADVVFVRENKGFDAGAYKYVLNRMKDEEFEAYDEILFCNDTFFPLFESLNDIFDEMRNIDCDFWGFNGFLNNIFNHIQSFFLVFRKTIIQSGALQYYFENNIDEYTEELNVVWCQFETGLYDYLVRVKQFMPAIYAIPNLYDIYKYSYGCISQCRMPILKKKAFRDFKENEDNILCTLSYVKYHCKYDMKYITEAVKRCYGYEIAKEDIMPLETYTKPVACKIQTPLRSENEIEQMIKGKDFYIYGTGMYAHKTYWRFARENKNFCGFIISDNQEKDRSRMFGNEIFRYSEVRELGNKKILLGVGKAFAGKILKQMSNRDNVIQIF